jgi:hypothetical protein
MLFILCLGLLSRSAAVRLSEMEFEMREDPTLYIATVSPTPHLATEDAISAVGEILQRYLPHHCSDGILDNQETDIDCGGDCAGCVGGKLCDANVDCASELCRDDSRCQADSLANFMQGHTQGNIGIAPLNAQENMDTLDDSGTISSDSGIESGNGSGNGSGNEGKINVDDLMTGSGNYFWIWVLGLVACYLCCFFALRKKWGGNKNGADLKTAAVNVRIEGTPLTPGADKGLKEADTAELNRPWDPETQVQWEAEVHARKAQQQAKEQQIRKAADTQTKQQVEKRRQERLRTEMLEEKKIQDGEDATHVSNAACLGSAPGHAGRGGFSGCLSSDGLDPTLCILPVTQTACVTIEDYDTNSRSQSPAVLPLEPELGVETAVDAIGLEPEALRDGSGKPIFY